MNKYLFIPPFSNHAPHVHKGWITSYIKRIRLNCTKDIDFLLHKHTFFLRLLVRGYELKFLIPIFDQKINRPIILKKLIQKKISDTNLVPSLKNRLQIKFQPGDNLLPISWHNVRLFFSLFKN